MKDILEKLTSYNLFNYLLPGIIFAAMVSNLTTLKLIQTDIVVGVFVYYFLGLIISRVGSLLIEPFLIQIGFLKFAPYTDFMAASKNDPKIEVLSESNNMYRTFCAMLILTTIVKLYEYISAKFQFFVEHAPNILIITLLILFLFSHRKQTAYITKRVKEKK
jgi:hypothetical protein